MAIDLETVYDRLFVYCQSENFAGYDPFDGLNSVLFQATPLKHMAPARLAWLQMVKRSAVNLRPVLRIKKGVNPKALALFALAELSRFRATRDDRHGDNANTLVELLLDARTPGTTADEKNTIAFGYNFDWQSRNFYAPLGTPAIVPTAFALQAFVEAYEAIGTEKYLTAAQEICRFILTGLNRPIETDDELCFSYTPLDRSMIYNASLLAGECLARVGAITGNSEYLETAAKTVRFVINRQRSDGAWAYGENRIQAWVDNFHTAYILLSIKRISDRVPAVAHEIVEPQLRGSCYWLDNFFLDDGTPKYYDKSVYPVDVHSAAAAIVAMCELTSHGESLLPLAVKTAEWTTTNLCGREGFFYYQKRKSATVKMPFMRWGQAWMAYALARLIEVKGSAANPDIRRGTSK
ncbi:MAG: hypothetical protein ACKVQJ_00920 [Pyrinomonadaceae bacterium]